MSKPFVSHSQAGQDRFAWELLGGALPRTFLDIGASHPTERSNTFALEQRGWTGWLVEADPTCAWLLREQRTSPVIEGDATSMDWRSLLPVPEIDYLSLDVDESSLATLRHLLDSGIRFKVITLEHDAYRFGDERRIEMMALLDLNGYTVLCPNVCDQGLPFEMWCVSDDFFGKPCRRFISHGPTCWKHFFPEAA